MATEGCLSLVTGRNYPPFPVEIALCEADAPAEPSRLDENAVAFSSSGASPCAGKPATPGNRILPEHPVRAE